MKRFETKHDYFDNLNSNKAYIIGYLLSDGNIGVNDSGNYYVKINLNVKDIEVLEFILNEIRPGDKPTTYKSKQRSGHVSDMCSIKITSNKICEYLINLGIVPQKTGKEYLPKIDTKFMPDMIRGIFDGDGCICKKKKGTYALTINSGCVDLVNGLKEYFGFGSVEKGHGNCWVYRAGSLDNIDKVSQVLYYSQDVKCLKRKKDIIDTMPRFVKYEAFGESKRLTEWSRDERCVVHKDTIRYRINNTNLTFEECITLPARSTDNGDMYKKNKTKDRKHTRTI